MNLVSIRLITDDVTALSDFYSRLTGVPADRPVEAFAEIPTASGTIAIGHTSTVALFGPGSAVAAQNRSAIVEFLVDDVDAAFDGLRTWVPTIVQAPTTMPWGNRSLLLRDPDGNLVNLFTPVTAAARAKFGVVGGS
jgi:catechol 2,3-dioxygenase-like lactoylglutathione lyase family enzyme